MVSKMWRGRATATLAAVLLSVAETSTSVADNQAQVLPVDPSPLVAETDSGEHAFKIEIADDQAERTAGLMYRNFLPENQGMLFIFEQTQQVGFWMKDTPLPLDLIFIDEGGRVAGIREGKPLSEALISPGVPVRFVLELKKGTAAKAGIEDGDVIRHPRIESPIRPTNPG
ncbi:MAG: DUF192 domain-containing protein [Rhizobiaceae bacterium]